MPTRLRTSLLASCLALTLASLVAGCSASDDSSPSDAPQATESAGDTTTADGAGPVDLAQWRDRAREAGVEQQIGEGIDSQCADVYPDAIAERAAEFTGLDIWSTEIFGLIEAPSLACSFTAEVDGWGQGSIELGSETDSPECATLSGVEADQPIDAGSARTLSARGCSSDGVLHYVSVMAWEEDSRYSFVENTDFVEEITALMIDEQDTFMDEALALYAQLV